MQSDKVFRDPVHVNINFSRTSNCDNILLKLIDSPQVQRLRHVRQLAVANAVYHGAEHSRFSHSLGVTHFARRFCNALKKKYPHNFTENDEIVVMVSALLHDTGHPPFSHAVEKTIGVDHEDMTIRTIKGSTEVNKILDSEIGGELIDKICSHITGTSDDKTASIISSQLDADRMDYLLRDGYHAGVPNSQFDYERIIQLTELDNDGLLYDYRALFAIEGYFMARFHLYQQLYYHKTVRAYEVVLRNALKRAKFLLDSGSDLGQIDDKLKDLFRTNSPDSALKLSDHDLWMAFRVWQEHEDAILSDLSKRLFNRRPFKSIEVPTDKLTDYYNNDKDKITELAKNNNLDPDYYIILDTAKDTPYKVLNTTSSDALFTSVRLKKYDGSIDTLEHISNVIKMLQDNNYQKNRICFPGELRDEISKILTKN